MGNSRQAGAAKASPALEFTEAITEKSYGRLALMGPASSGKTFTALRVARSLLEMLPEERRRVAVIGGEARAAAKYVRDFPDLKIWFHQPREHSPATYTWMMREAERQGFGCLIVDSLSHAWSGLGGALELVDSNTQQAGNGNKFTSGWSVVSPIQNTMIDTALAVRCHVIACLRVKTEYQMVKNQNGKLVPEPVGLKPIQREGVEYEFDVLCSLDAGLNCSVIKTRCKALRDKSWKEAGEKNLGKAFAKWLGAGEGDLERAAEEAEPEAGQGADFALAGDQGEPPPPAEDQSGPPPGAEEALGPQDQKPKNGTVRPEVPEIRLRLKARMAERCAECHVDPDEWSGRALNEIVKALGISFSTEELVRCFTEIDLRISDWAPPPPPGPPPAPAEDGIPF